MGKIYVPSNVYLSRNAEKQIVKIESNNNFEQLIDKINEMMEFVSNSPTYYVEARARGWKPEILSNNKNGADISFRITQGDRFTYHVSKNGEVEILGVLGHYKGTAYGLYKPRFDELEDLIKGFYEGNISYKEMLEKSNGAVIRPDFGGENKEELETMKEKIASGTIQKEDIKSLEIEDGENHFYLSREDIKEEKGEKEEEHSHSL